MIYFAMLAMVATLRSIVALLATTVVVAVHHLTLGLFLPALVYPSVDLLVNLERTVFHAVIVLVETAVLARMILVRAQSDAGQDAAQAEQPPLPRQPRACARRPRPSVRPPTWLWTQLGERLQRMAGGNLDVRITEELPPAYEGLRSDFNSTIGVLSDLVSQNAYLAGQFATEARAVASAASSMAHGLENHANEVNETLNRCAA